MSSIHKHTHIYILLSLLLLFLLVQHQKSMAEKNVDEMDVKEVKSELSTLYGIKDFSGCLDIADLREKLHKARNTELITYGHQYGPLLTRGNTNSPTGVVLLSHGLGDSAHGWDDVGRDLSRRLPHLLFLLPTAPERPVTINGGMPMPAWYDIFSMISKGLKSGKQDGEGVLQSVAYLSSLAQTAAKKYRFCPQRVVYAGFSQGAAISLAAGLTTAVKPAGIVSMSGYLAALNTILPMFKNKVPVAMYHGSIDPVVPLDAAKETKEVLKESLGIEAEFREYFMQHSAVPEEVDHVEQFLKKVLPN